MKNTIFVIAFVAAILFAMSGVAAAQSRDKLVRAAIDKCEEKFPFDAIVNDEKKQDALDKCIEAADAIPHPIDAALEKCLADKHGTFPRAECYSTAARAWEAAVHANYQKLQTVIPAKLLGSLKANQLAWEKFKLSLEEFYADKNAGQRGTMHIAGRIIENIDIWKPRAVFLEGLVDQYDRSKP